MNLNVSAPFFRAREVGRRCMIPRWCGKIINVASAAGLKGMAAGVHTIATEASRHITGQYPAVDGGASAP